MIDLLTQRRNDAIRKIIKEHTDDLLSRGSEACREYITSILPYRDDGSFDYDAFGKDDFTQLTNLSQEYIVDRKPRERTSDHESH